MTEVPRSLLLASASPRRRDLLRQAGWRVRVRPAPIDERRRGGETPRQYVLRLARHKAAWAAHHHASRLPILAADTTVAIAAERGGRARIYGKPRTAAAARRMLRGMSGGWHEVWTALALLDPVSGRIWSSAVRTRVRFARLTAPEIAAYIGTGEPFDKAGGYALQGRAALWIPAIAGSPSNVIGLPLSEFYKLWLRYTHT